MPALSFEDGDAPTARSYYASRCCIPGRGQEAGSHHCVGGRVAAGGRMKDNRMKAALRSGGDRRAAKKEGHSANHCLSILAMSPGMWRTVHRGLTARRGALPGGI